MMTRTIASRIITVAACAALACFSLPSPAAAADHGDAPAVAQDLGADINDVFFFLDPTDITQTVLIATVHGFLMPGRVLDLAEFDANIRYRFEIYNDHVNFVSPVLNATADPAVKDNFLKSIKPNRIIDVTFSKREVGLASQVGTFGDFIPRNLRRPLRQQATLTFTGFPGLNSKAFNTDINGDTLLVTPFNVSFTNPAPAFDVRNIKIAPSTTIQFFAGEVDDPYFLDVPALNSFTDGIRNGFGPTVSAFTRARDTFAGYNTLAIAIRIPTVLLLSNKGSFLGLDFLTQRRINQVVGGGSVTSSGGFKTVDRMGNPTGVFGLIPFDQRNAYNAANAHQDAQGKFRPVLNETLKELGLVITPTPEAAYTALADALLAYGDILQLDTSISNFSSPAGAGYDHKDGSGFALPNGRRLQDDTVDIVLTTINHNMTVGDGVANSGTGSNAVTTSFPFLGKPNQPLGSGTTDPTQN